MGEVRVWNEYYTHFGIEPRKIRDGCHPRIIYHGENQKNAIVLVHGLTDSPYFMEDIGEYFHSKIQFNVYIPLLRAHGLKEPKGMKDAALNKWKEEVLFAVDEAQKSSQTVSIGGLSTGGALSVYMALKSPDKIKGGVFLFSAALDIAGHAGDFLEIVLRTPIANIQDFFEGSRFNLFGKYKELVDDDPDGNPYRYSRMDKGGAQQLSSLIYEIDRLTEVWGKKEGLTQPVFAVHSEFDTAADINEVEELIEKSRQAEIFRIKKDFFVPHASVVLKRTVKARNYSPLEPQNPFFDDMMKSIHEFAKKHSIL